MAKKITPLSFIVLLVCASATQAQSAPSATSGRLDIRIVEPTIQLNRVRVATAQSPTKSKHDSLLNGALIGAAVGTAYGFVVLSVVNSGGDRPQATAIPIPIATAAMGAGIGALIDFLKRGRGDEDIASRLVRLDRGICVTSAR